MEKHNEEWEREEYYFSGALFPWDLKTRNEGLYSNEDTKGKKALPFWTLFHTFKIERKEVH